jgi:chain length determinant protein EpsF
MTLAQFLSILRARWIAALAMFIIVVAATIGASLVWPKSYTATVSVVIDGRSVDPIAGTPNTTSPAYLATQMDIINSTRVAIEVIRTLRMAERPEIRERWLSETKGRGNYEAWVAELISKKLMVKPARESSVINISYSASDPRFAAVIANTFAQAYINVSIGLRASPAKQYSEFFDQRSKELRQAVEHAQEKLSSYQKEHNLLNADERFDIETQRLNELNTQYTALQALAIDSTSRTLQARNSSDKIQETSNNGLVSTLRADLSRQEAKLREMTSRLGEEHPQVKELRANIAELTQRLDTETRRIASGLDISNTINRQREAEIRKSLDAQRVKVLKLKAQRDEAQVLQREVETAQRAYEQITLRLNQASLESQLTQTNIAVLSPAVEPSDASSPNIGFNAMLSTCVGLLLGITLALLLEITDRRVRTPDDLTLTLDLPILGTLPKAVSFTTSTKKTSIVLPQNVLQKLVRPAG